MTNRTGKDVSFKIDNASGTITTISTSLNSASITGTLTTLEDTALSEGNSTFVSGIAGATKSINGFWNSTTEPIFGPLIGNRTSITKTTEYGDGSMYYNGEVWVTNVQVSGQVNTLETFSADLTFSGAVNRTSVAL